LSIFTNINLTDACLCICQVSLYDDDDDVIFNGLTMARTATDAIRKHCSFIESVTGATLLAKNAFISKKNFQHTLAPAGGACSAGPEQGLFNSGFNPFSFYDLVSTKMACSAPDASRKCHSRTESVTSATLKNGPNKVFIAGLCTYT
jgi:hypothetical protein